jgi:hypothetical protein
MGHAATGTCRDTTCRCYIMSTLLILLFLFTKAFWAVSMFDYFHVTQVWIKFWWRDRTMAWYRYQFCYPRTTYNTQCAVPVYSNPDDETVSGNTRYICNHEQPLNIIFLGLISNMYLGVVSTNLQFYGLYIDQR